MGMLLFLILITRVTFILFFFFFSFYCYSNIFLSSLRCVQWMHVCGLIWVVVFRCYHFKGLFIMFYFLQIYEEWFYFFFLLIFWRYTKWGGRLPHRPAEDLAFAVARFFQRGGSFQNYYMVWYIVKYDAYFDQPKHVAKYNSIKKFIRTLKSKSSLHVLLFWCQITWFQIPFSLPPVPKSISFSIHV